MNAGTLSLEFQAEALVTPTVNAYVGGGSVTIQANSLFVNATLQVPLDSYMARAYSSGSSGGLIGVDATISNAITTSSVKSYVAQGTTLDITGGTTLFASNNSRQYAEANSNVGGLVAAGVSTANAKSNATTEATLDANAQFTGGSLTITALGHDDNYADTTTGSGGAIAGAAAISNTDTVSNTSARIKSGNVNLSTRGSGNLNISANHTSTFNSRIRTTAGGVLAGAGAVIDNTVDADVTSGVGSNVIVNAKDIQITATNRARKDWLYDSGNSSPAYNINGTTGGLVSGAGVVSETVIDFNTQVVVGDHAELNVVGNPSSPGALTLRALNDIVAKDKVSFETGGALAGASTDSRIDAQNNVATVNIGEFAKLSSIGAINISARGTGTGITKVDAQTYGAGTVALGVSEVKFNPTNTVEFESNSHVRADGDLNISTGTSVDFVRDDYELEARMDTFAGSAIPIDDTNAVARLFQTNTITINSNAVLETGRDARLHAEKFGYAESLLRRKP